MPAKTFQEGDIKTGVRKGGHVRAVFVIARSAEHGAGYVVYIRTSWTRGFRPLRTDRNQADRVYRDLDLLVALVRKKFAYPGEISIFEAGDEALQRFKLLLPADREALSHDSNEHDPAKQSVVDQNEPMEAGGP